MKYTVGAVALILLGTISSINIFPNLFGIEDDEEFVDNGRGVEDFEETTGAEVSWDDEGEMLVDWPVEE